MKDAVKVLSLYYREHKEEFIARFDGQYIVMADEQTVIPFESFAEAYWYGVHNYGLGFFTLIHCVEEEPMHATGFVVPALH